VISNSSLYINKIPDKSINSSRIYLQLTLYLVGFMLLAVLEYYFTNLSNEYLKNIDTENVRLQIGVIINEDIRKIETLTYKLATSKGRQRQNNFKKKLELKNKQLNQALDVLENGGEIRRIKRLNLVDKNTVDQKIIYKKTQIENQFILEVIELRPKISKVRIMVDHLFTLIQQRDNKNTRLDYEQKALKVKNQLQLISPLFERVTENANRLFYEGQQRLDDYQRTFQERKKHYNHLQLFLSLGIMLLVLLFGYYILRQVQTANEKLSETSKELNFQIKALNAHAIVSSTDTAGKIISVNQRFCEISGYTENELIGNDHRIINSGEHSPAVFENLWATIASGEIWQGEIKNRAKDGSFYWVNASIVPLLDDDNKPFRYIAIRNDITQRKQMQEEIDKSHRFLQSVTDTMGEGVYTLNKEGLCTSVNPEFERITGWMKEAILNQNLHDLIHFQTLDGTFVSSDECPTHKSINNGLKYVSDDEYFTHKKGHLFPVSIISVPLYEDKEVVGSVSIFRDISIRKATENALLDAKFQAEQASKDKSNFLANMSHEIRTPMNAIIGMSYLALETDLNPEQKNYIKKVHYSAESLLKIINDILDFSKIEAGKLEVENIEFEFKEMIDNVENILRDKSTEHNNQLNIVIDKNIPPVLVGDAQRLNQILINLGSNALKFSENGQVTITTSLDASSEEDKSMLHFSVKDNGIGISEAQQNRLFQSFSQADASITRKYGGTGLGLIISQQLTELMGGKIWFESEPGQGSTFHFTAQVENVKDANKSQLKLKKNKINKQRYQQSAEQLCGASILLVEDNAFNQELAVKLLNKHNIHVIVANNGEEALQCLESDIFDGILMDIQMPVMDGFEATARIRMDKRFIHLPIIAMSANNMVGDVEKAMDAGMNDYISKPVNIKKMFTTMAKWINITNVIKEQSEIETVKETDEHCLILPGFNYTGALERFENDKALYLEVLKVFAEEHADNMNEIINLLDNEQLKEAQLTAHTFKGVTANIGAEKLNQYAVELESCIKKSSVPQHDCKEIISITAQTLKNDINNIEQFLSQQLLAQEDLQSSQIETRSIEIAEIEASEIILILNEFLSLLQAYDTRASKKLESIVKMPFAQQYPDTFNDLKTCISHYDFEQGSSILSKLIEIITPNPK